MICRSHKRSIAWLLIAGMLNLALIAAQGGMAMANPSQGEQLLSIQLVASDSPPCQQDVTPLLDQIMDLEQAACDGCNEDACNESCSICAQVPFGVPAHAMSTALELKTTTVAAFSPKLAGPGYTPIPRPPRQLHS